MATPDDPTQALGDSAESKPHTMSALVRCLDFLTINSKLAALHVQYSQDAEVLKIVIEVEMLAHELSNKIWQKIMILDVKVKEVVGKEEGKAQVS